MSIARLALIGSGTMAAVHAASIAANPRTELVAVAGGRGASTLASLYNARHRDVETVFADSDVDGVVIASPNGVHVDHILAAAAEGKAALVEKPVDLDLARVDDCIQRVGSATQRIAVAFNRRFDPSFALARTRAVNGAIGAITQVTITSRDPAPPPLAYLPSSGGIFRDMTIHDIDMARHLLGEIDSVTATIQFTDAEISSAGEPDGAVTVLTTSSGAIATIINSRRNSFGYDQRLEVFGPAGSLSVSNPAESTVTIADASSSATHDRILTAYSDRYAAAYRAEIAHLADIILDGATPAATLDDGR